MSRRLFGSAKPKSVHSLENLKYLYSVLVRHQTVTESNRALLVETLRSISEILIWGDQNDSSVFDYFLEKNMLVFFLKYLEQKSGQYICVQLLQTLNILFENISNETSTYYLLSNNHVNSIIAHKFDFSDEEVMAYFISFMKTLSLKLNKHTIHFFFNEQSEDFTLYTEAIRYFNHPESMVRIAVRTITLNVYKVDNGRMQTFIRERTAVPYFSNLVWYMGNHIMELDSCVRNDIDHKSRDRLKGLVAEHLENLQYLNDILSLGIEQLSNILTDYLLNRLFIPLYVLSLTMEETSQSTVPHISKPVALFLLSQVFLILHHKPLVRQLASILLGVTKDLGVTAITDSDLHPRVPKFIAPTVLLNGDFTHQDKRSSQSTFYTATGEDSDSSNIELETSNTTDDEKLGHENVLQNSSYPFHDRPYMKAIYDSLDISIDDFTALLAVLLLYAIGENEGINQELLDVVSLTTKKSAQKNKYNEQIVTKLIRIVRDSSHFAGKVRLVTLELSIMVLKMLVLMDDGASCLHDEHLAVLLATKEESMSLLSHVFKTEDMFLDMFEDEYREMSKRKINVEYLTMDASILLQPTNTPLTGIEFTKRLPCGEVERIRKAIRVFFHIRQLLQSLTGFTETQMPLTNPNEDVKVDEVLDLNNSDLIGCTIIKDSSPAKKERRFLVIGVTQLIMVEPDASRLGWGVVRFSGYLQDTEVAGDSNDSRCLHVIVHKPASSHLGKPTPLLKANFIFDDHIRCMAAKQRLTKGRAKARQRKMMIIAQMLDMPNTEVGGLYNAVGVGSSVFNSSLTPLPGRVVSQTDKKPKLSSSMGDLVESSFIEQGLDVSKQDVFQALNNSSFDNTCATHQRFASENPLPSSANEVTGIQMSDLSPGCSNRNSSSETDSRTQSSRSRSNSGLILPFGTAAGDLKDI